MQWRMYGAGLGWMGIGLRCWGFRLGAFLSLTLATDAAMKIRAVVELSGGLPEQFAAGATSDFPPTLIVHGAEDNVVPVASAHALDALLTRLNVVHQTLILPRQGHWFDGEGQMQILLAVGGFLAQQL